MALPLLRWSCRRPAVGLNTYLKLNKQIEIRNQSVVKNQASLSCVVSGVRYCSSDREGRRQTRKVVVVGIPNPFIWFRTKFCFFLIRAYFDKDFSIEEFTDGAKQVSCLYFMCHVLKRIPVDSSSVLSIYIQLQISHQLVRVNVQAGCGEGINSPVLGNPLTASCVMVKLVHA